MNAYVNALLLRFDGVNGEDIPSKSQVAITWGAAAALAMIVLRS